MLKNKKHVYIVLSDTGTIFTRLIRFYTKAPRNHASIAFDLELKEVYSFGRKNPRNPFSGGFVKENLHDALSKDATLVVYRCSVSECQYKKIRTIIARFEEEAHLYKYNLPGVLGIVLNIPVKRRYAFFCSQFVASVFEQAGARLVHKCAALTTPADLEQSGELELMD
ncbi:hypothetical protein BRE01_15480 [Brevibacillus reuszeri]|uniref:Uncharacterized protein n=1 Tax=Brevibacillus reuszeri TaxID=54915 RepID=A0A0K9Z0S8_9BACL|nr:hypothetical protein [Brevibacillus reuszeri]KNB74526.1 hypothetical protein ADS79_02240 [Brevibacillus reuszeri]MED1856458.1 hypothetical protein [Brevibacillus reuszeri]GED67846.1 hypothetical protein BRE01_15480 [Brevibacillus reuszeri]